MYGEKEKRKSLNGAVNCIYKLRHNNIAYQMIEEKNEIRAISKAKIILVSASLSLSLSDLVNHIKRTISNLCHTIKCGRQKWLRGQHQVTYELCVVGTISINRCRPEDVRRAAEESTKTTKWNTFKELMTLSCARKIAVCTSYGEIVNQFFCLFRSVQFVICWPLVSPHYRSVDLPQLRKLRITIVLFCYFEQIKMAFGTSVLSSLFLLLFLLVPIVASLSF